jgi:hypothetical protein
LNPRLRPWQGRTLPLSYSRSVASSGKGSFACAQDFGARLKRRANASGYSRSAVSIINKPTLHSNGALVLRLGIRRAPRGQKDRDLTVVGQSAETHARSVDDFRRLNSRTVDSVESPDKRQHFWEFTYPVSFAALEHAHDCAPGAVRALSVRAKSPEWREAIGYRRSTARNYRH